MTYALAALPQGTRLHNGTYATGPVLGQGGFGITYKGGDLARKRYVAIKEFFPQGAVRQGTQVVPSHDAASFAQGKADFLREAGTLARFENPSIVGVLDSFEANNTAYMVMEFLEGQTLGERIQAKGKLDEWEVLDIALRLAGALELVHDAGILHRDLKPDNVMLTRTGRAVLIDFGTARAFEGATQPMTQIVTPGYAPLEQYASNRRYGPTSDIYALGATLYHALGGVMPVAATDRAADVPLPALRTLNPVLSPVVANAVMRALEMDPALRPPSVRDFGAMLSGRTSPGPKLQAPQLQPQKPAVPMPAPNAEVSQVDSSLVLHNALERHTSVVNALAFSPDGGKLVSVGVDRMVNVWNWPMNTLATYFGAHEQGITAVGYSPDGKWLATGGRDEQVCIWDAAFPLTEGKRAPLALLRDCRGAVLDLAFCPVRRELLVGDANAITLWDASTGGIKARLDIAGAAVTWAPDGRVAAIGSTGSGILSFCAGDSLVIQGQLPMHQGELTDVAWSPDGTLFATSGSDGFLRVWNAAQGSLMWEQRPLPMAAACLAWSPDGKLLACAWRDTILLWTVRGELWRRYTKHKGQIQALAFAPQPPAPYRYVVASAARDHLVNVCRIKCDPVA